MSWLSPVKLRRTIVVGSKKMLMYDDTESVEKVKIFDHGVDFQGPGDVRRVPALVPHRRHLSPQRSTSTEPLCVEAAHFVECVATGTRPITDGRRRPLVVAALEAAQRSLD